MFKKKNCASPGQICYGEKKPLKDGSENIDVKNAFRSC